MTSSTTRAFVAKKPVATASAFMAKTNQLLSTMASLRLLLVMLLTLTVTTNAWGAETTYTVSASSGKLSNWSGSIGTAYNDGSVKFDGSGDNYSNAAIWSGEVSTGMTKLAVTI